MKISFRLLTLLILTLLLCSWGGSGHSYISGKSSTFFAQDMLNYADWETELTSHASDADDRKNWDATEAPKHYINFEKFTSFMTTGRVVQTVDSANSVYGSSFLNTNGYLPWATVTCYENLVDAFSRNDMTDIIYYAGDIGHYAADGHMPLHLTENYNGQLTNQTGVHSRIESTMISNYLSQISITPGHAVYITDVNSYIFSYCYRNFAYVDSLLDADAGAYAISGSYSNPNYYPSLWSRCNRQIKAMFQNGAQAIADLILTAAINGGVAVEGMEKPGEVVTIGLSPNPATVHSQVTIHVENLQHAETLEIINMQGQTLRKQPLDHFVSSETIEIGDLDAGIYLIKAGNSKAAKLVVTR